MRRFLVFLALSGYILTFWPGYVFGGERLSCCQPESLRSFFGREFLPSLHDVREAFLETYGGDPSAWPKEFRRIHHIGVSWSQRALDSEKFAQHFEKEERQRLRLQIESPVDYWSLAVWSGIGFDGWENARHLSARNVPRPLLGRFFEEIFPMMWRNLGSTVHRKEHMLGVDDSGFAPDLPEDNEALERQKKDLLAYNDIVREAVGKYAETEDLPMLAIMTGRADATWPHDEEFRSLLERQKNGIERKIAETLKAEATAFLRKVHENAEPVLRYRLEEDGSERHIFLDLPAVADMEGMSGPYPAGRTISVRQRDPWKDSGNDAPLVEEAPALSFGWAPFTFNGLLSEEMAEQIMRFKGCFLVRFQCDGNGRSLALFAEGAPQVGFRMDVEPAATPLPEGVFEEFADRFEKAFLLAAADFCGGPGPGDMFFCEKEPPVERTGRNLSVSLTGCERLQTAQDGRTLCGIGVYLTENGKPVAGSELAVEKPELGTLVSSRITGGDETTLFVTTDPVGRVDMVYHPPRTDGIAFCSEGQVTLGIRDDASGLRKEIGFMIVRAACMEVVGEHDLIPGDDSFPNRIRFRFSGNGDSEDRETHEVVLRSRSGSGLFSTGGNEWETSPAILAAEPGAWQEVLYKWGGASPRETPVDETVIVEVPQFNLYDTVDFKVGVMPVVTDIDIGQKQQEYPGTYVPLKVTVSDKLNPELDMERFLESFGLSPVVEIEPVDFTPLPLDEEDEKFLEKILRYLPGVTLQKETMTFQPEEWLLAREEGKGWVLAGKSPGFAPGGLEKWESLPGFIPWLWGDYTFRIRLAFEGDDGLSGGAFGQTGTHVLAFRPEDEEKSSRAKGIMPLILLYSAMFPGDEARLVTLKAERLIGERGPAESAAVLGDAFFRNLATGRTSHDQPGLEDRLREMAAASKGTAPKDLDGEDFRRIVENAKLYFLCCLGGGYLDRSMELSLRTETRDPLFRTETEEEKRSLEILQGFLSGFGDYGLAAVSRKGLRELAVYDERGNRLAECPDRVFSSGGRNDRLYMGENMIVVVFRLGETLVLDISGSGAPVQAAKILPNGINRTMCCEGGKRERLTLFGDVVVPVQHGAFGEVP